MNAERLLKLADFLETLPPERFDYSDWVGWNWKGDQTLSCGTPACALGWAAAMPEFRELGLQLIACPAAFRDGVIGKIGLKDDPDCGAEHASAVIFGLSEDEHDYLFVPDWSNDLDENASAKEVADHIRRFVEERS